ncbi:MAG: hypothetical protein ACE10C_00975, partial [Candidatus Binatia bacterium]
LVRNGECQRAVFQSSIRQFCRGSSLLPKGGVNPFFWTADLTGLWSLPDPFKDFVMGTGLADHDVPSVSAQTAQKTFC